MAPPPMPSPTRPMAGIDVLIRPHKRLDLSIDRRQALVALAERADLARLSWGDRAHARADRDAPHAAAAAGRRHGRAAAGRLPAGDQARRATMRAAVNAWIGDAPKLADLFAGVGALSLGRPGRLSLFESDKPSVAAVDAAARKIGGNRVIAERRDLFRNPLRREGTRRLRRRRARSAARGRRRAGRGNRALEGARGSSMPRAIPAASRATRARCRTAGTGWRN